MSPEYPQFPLYVVSKGRHQYMMTSKALTQMQARHFVVVEPQQVQDYQESINRLGLLCTVLPLDMSYKACYRLLDDLGLSKSTGPGPARNFCWDHSMSNGFSWHWVMDDNIRHFYRMNHNLKFVLNTPAFWRAMEDFCLRYENLAMAGPNYEMFAPRKQKHPPIILNTRIYSCNLIRNDLPFRWRGRYNEDTILSLDLLKAGWCTVEFNAFLQKKVITQSIPGGCTAEFYHVEGTVKPGQSYAENGTVAKSEMLAAVHPDVARKVWKFGRWHHYVDYSMFERNQLIRKPGIQIPEGVNNYGMTLIPVPEQQLATEEHPEDFQPDELETDQQAADEIYWQHRDEEPENKPSTQDWTQAEQSQFNFGS